MIYQYRCPQCTHRFDVVKSVKDIELDEQCPFCLALSIREFAPTRIYLNGTKVEDAEYNPGLGCIVKNKNHRKELCKIKGVEEIGNEKPETIHKHFEKERQERWEKSWSEVDKGWVGDGT